MVGSIQHLAEAIREDLREVLLIKEKPKEINSFFLL